MSTNLTSDTWAQEIRLFGTPWHGLVTGGSLALPNASTMTYKQPSEFSVKTDEDYLASWYYDAAAAGTTHLIAIPDIPAVTRSEAEQAADEAAGRQWRNKALLSGGRFQLYGKDLRGWIYVDPNNDRWLVECDALWPYPPRTSGDAIETTVRLTRFGVIDLDNPDQTPEYYDYDVSLSGWIAWETNYDKVYPQVAAISRTGNKAAVSLAVWTIQPYEFPVVGYLELAISGAGSDATVSLSVLRTHEDCFTLDETGGDMTQIGQDTWTIVLTWDNSWLVALWYDDDGEIVEVRLTSSGSMEQVVEYIGYRYGGNFYSTVCYSHSEQGSVTGSLICGNATVDGFSGSISGSGQYDPNDLTLHSSGVLTWNGQEFGASRDVYQPEAGVWYSIGFVGQANASIEATSGVTATSVVRTIQHCLHAASLVKELRYSDGGPEVYEITGGPAATPSGAKGENVSLDYPAHPYRRRNFFLSMNPRPDGFYYGSYDWITGDVKLWQPGPVCFV